MTFLSQAARHLVRQEVNKNVSRGGFSRKFASLDAFDDYGKSVFSGKVADDYMKMHGASGAVLNDPTWVRTHADTVAKAVFDW
jgi:hypothetical protein